MIGTIPISISNLIDNISRMNKKINNIKSHISREEQRKHKIIPKKDNKVNNIKTQVNKKDNLMNNTNTLDTQELPTAPDEPDSAIKAKRTRAPQNQQHATEISEAALFLTLLDKENELADLLALRGIDKAERDLGKQLHSVAQSAFDQRQSTMGREDASLAEVNRLLGVVKKDYTDFRSIARVKVLTPGGRVALGLKGALPTDRQGLVTLVRASYRVAAQPEFQGILARAGYSVSQLADLQRDVDALEEAIAISRDARGSAERATASRVAAIRSLRQWTSAVKTVARRSLQDRPDLLGKLGL